MDVKVKQRRVENEPAEVSVLSHLMGNRIAGGAAAVDRALQGAVRDLLKNRRVPRQSLIKRCSFNARKDVCETRLLVGLEKERRETGFCSTGHGHRNQANSADGARSFTTVLHGRSIPECLRS